MNGIDMGDGSTLCAICLYSTGHWIGATVCVFLVAVATARAMYEV